MFICVVLFGFDNWERFETEEFENGVDYLKRMNVASSSQEQIPVNRY
jgi:hypothetical protein